MPAADGGCTTSIKGRLSVDEAAAERKNLCKLVVMAKVDAFQSC